MSITAKLTGVSALSATMGEKQTFQATLHGIGSGSATAPIRLVEVTLLAANWVGEESPYSQVVAVDGVTEYSKVDLQPSVEQLEIFHDKDVAFSTENEDGVITVYAIGDKPTQDYNVQATVMEVSL